VPSQLQPPGAQLGGVELGHCLFAAISPSPDRDVPTDDLSARLDVTPRSPAGGKA